MVQRDRSIGQHKRCTPDPGWLVPTEAATTRLQSDRDWEWDVANPPTRSPTSVLRAPRPEVSPEQVNFCHTSFPRRGQGTNPPMHLRKGGELGPDSRVRSSGRHVLRWRYATRRCEGIVSEQDCTPSTPASTRHLHLAECIMMILFDGTYQRRWCLGDCGGVCAIWRIFYAMRQSPCLRSFIQGERATEDEDQMLIGASMRLTLLNWTTLQSATNVGPPWEPPELRATTSSRSKGR